MSWFSFTKKDSKLLAVLLVIITSCISNDYYGQDRAHLGVHMPEDVKPYYDEFLEKCAASQYADRCRDNLPGLTSISYVKNMSRDYVGTCFFVEVWIQKFSHITLLERYKHASEYTKKALIFHELAHCLMDLDHTEHPGIMAPNLTYEMEYRRNWEKWEHELFHGDQNVDIFPIIPFR